MQLYAPRYARPDVRKGRGRACRVKTCCERPAPVSFWGLAHERGESVVDLPCESQWWLECYSCGYVCTCEV